MPLPSSPTGRVPQWVLDEALGHPTEPIPWRSDLPWPGPVAPAPRRRRGLRGLLAVVAVLGLGGGAVALGERGPGLWDPPGAQTIATPPPPVDASLRDTPVPGVEAAPTPLGRPMPPPPGGGAYGFVTLQADGVTPVTYDPCRPVHYVIRLGQAPPGGEQLVHEAVQRLSAVSGLRFVYDGPTDEAALPQRSAFQPERYGDRWSPVLIDWQTEVENPALAGDLVGQAGSAAASLGDGPKVYVSGTVSLDATQLPDILADDDDGADVVRAVVLHELGHLIGLAHVDDDTQLMYPETRSGVTDYADGDLTGLARLGAGPCVPEL
ncbi:MAG: peptidase metallopeptidase [Blastococcus sp.]|jgi:hypothetical protein|nr:peptidase metallopeptidase [Blastococcus sp.]